MAYLKPGEVRSMGKSDREARLNELRRELMNERGVAAMGGSPPSPGKIRQLRRQIARIITIEREDALGIRRNTPRRTRAAAAKKSESEKPAPKKAAGSRPTPTEGKSGGHE